MSESNHPHWDLILSHVAYELHQALPFDAWATENQITGSSYLQMWMNHVRHGIRVPYLFLWGPQNSGKTILADAMAILLDDNQAVRGGTLFGHSPFNAFLAQAKLVQLELMCVKPGEDSYRLQGYTNDQTIIINKIGEEPRRIPNRLNFVHTASNLGHCPVGIDRLLPLYVPAFETEEIPKPILLRCLRGEMFDFLRTIQQRPATGELPVIKTNSVRV